jgi:nickel transport protein
MYCNIAPAMRVLLLAWLIAAAGAAHAHDLWLEKEDGGFGLYYGHKHSSHQGATFVEYRREWVREALCFNAAGARIPFESDETYPYRMRGECAAAYVSISSGYWTKTPYGTENVSKDQARMPVKSWLSHDSVKRIDHWSESLARPLAGGLELTPLEDPLILHTGEKLHLRVTFDGEPVKDAVVAYDGKPRGQPGSDGAINIRVRHGGFQVIQASLTRSIASEKADEVVYSTNLNFELPEE